MLVSEMCQVTRSRELPARELGVALVIHVEERLHHPVSRDKGDFAMAHFCRFDKLGRAVRGDERGAHPRDVEVSTIHARRTDRR